MNILFNGCSYTWGDELEDRTKRFSDLIGGVNISGCGRSNDGIARTTVDWFKHNEYFASTLDLVVIQWTIMSRMEFYHEEQRYVNILNREKNKKVYDKHWKYWYDNCYNDQFGVDNLYKNVFLIKNYLESLNIKYFFLFHDCWFEHLFMDSSWKTFLPRHVIRGHAQHTNTILPHKSICPECYMPKDHPSEKGHQLIADYIKHHAHIL